MRPSVSVIIADDRVSVIIADDRDEDEHRHILIEPLRVSKTLRGFGGNADQ